MNGWPQWGGKLVTLVVILVTSTCPGKHLAAPAASNPFFAAKGGQLASPVVCQVHDVE